MGETNAEAVTGMSKQEIAEAEGFGNTAPDSLLTDWDEFISAYYGLNANKFLEDRKHYFIKFRLVETLVDTRPRSLLDIFSKHSAHGKYMVPEDKTADQAVADLKKE